MAAVTLPNDEMKGRIIGREGRNIRAFETATGVDVIIDDTPDTVIVSCFDPDPPRGGAPLARGADPGRPDPPGPDRGDRGQGRRRSWRRSWSSWASRRRTTTGVHGLHPELIKLIGRMRYRTSYGQNIYEHSKEVAWLAGMMAAELQLDPLLAKRGGLLHDIGKVLTHEQRGDSRRARRGGGARYGESAAVINCIQAHHDDVPHETAESVLVQAADAISGAARARGARRSRPT